MPLTKVAFAWLATTLAVCVGAGSASLTGRTVLTQQAAQLTSSSQTPNATGHSASTESVNHDSDALVEPTLNFLPKAGHELSTLKPMVPAKTSAHPVGQQSSPTPASGYASSGYSSRTTPSAHASVQNAPTHSAARSGASNQTAQPENTSAHSTAAPSDSDLYWLARLIEAEAGAEPMQTKIAVGDVIVNRVHSSDYPDTVKGVIFQHAYGVYEFTSVENGWIYHTPSAQSVEAAKKVLDDHDNIVPQALVFYNSSKTSAGSWVRSQPVITVIGDMTFAK